MEIIVDPFSVAFHREQIRYMRGMADHIHVY